ncbi:UNVERIFIED_CONTAM: hypothetical protein Sindi_0288100 [Sesamum indicum]
MIQKSLKNLRSFRRKENILSLEKDSETMALDYMLIDAESVTISLLESMLSHVTGTKVQARKPGWSLVSKLMLSKKGSYQGEETDLNEFEKVDAVLQMSREDNTQVDEFLNHLKRMDSSIQILEEELELLFRKYQNQSLPPQHSQSLVNRFLTDTKFCILPTNVTSYLYITLIINLKRNYKHFFYIS